MSEAPEYAKGLAGVIANESKLSQVKGEEGVLRYLGYNINDLVTGNQFRSYSFI